MEHEKFKDFASGVQSIAITIAVIIGGGWTLITFEKLRQAPTAEATYSKLIQELERYRVVNISIEPDYECLEGSPRYLLVAKVKIENVGNQTEIFKWPAMPVTFRSIDFQVGLNLVIGGPHGTRLSETVGTKENGIRILPGSTYYRTFVAPALKPGPQYIQFFAESSPEDQQQAVTQGVQATVGWASDSYINVPAEACQSR